MSGAGSKGKDIPRVNVTDLAAGLGARFAGGPPTSDTQPSHTPHTPNTRPSDEGHTESTRTSDTSRTTKPGAGSAQREGRPRKAATSEPVTGNIRRSLYTDAAAFAALDEAAERIAAATGGLVLKHDAVARLLHAGVARTDEVIAEITRELTARLTPPADNPRTFD